MPALSIKTLLKVATPDEAGTDPPPLRVAPAVPVPAVIDNDTDAELLVTTFPAASSMDTWIAGDIAVQDVALDGWAVNATCAGGPMLIVNAALVAPSRPLPEAERV